MSWKFTLCGWVSIKQTLKVTLWKLVKLGNLCRSFSWGQWFPHSPPSLEWGRSFGQTPCGLCREDTQGLCGSQLSKGSLVSQLSYMFLMAGQRSPKIYFRGKGISLLYRGRPWHPGMLPRTSGIPQKFLLEGPFIPTRPRPRTGCRGPGGWVFLKAGVQYLCHLTSRHQAVSHQEILEPAGPPNPHWFEVKGDYCHSPSDAADLMELWACLTIDLLVSPIPHRSGQIWDGFPVLLRSGFDPERSDFSRSNSALQQKDYAAFWGILETSRPVARLRHQDEPRKPGSQQSTHEQFSSSLQPRRTCAPASRSARNARPCADPALRAISWDQAVLPLHFWSGVGEVFWAIPFMACAEKMPRLSVGVSSQKCLSNHLTFWHCPG